MWKSCKRFTGKSNLLYYLMLQLNRELQADTLPDQKWYFSIQDVLAVLTDSVNIKDYIKKLRKRDSSLNSNWGTICPLVEMPTPDGKVRKIQSANAEDLFRIIQSIPSPKAEPFKRWFAMVGF